MATAVEAVQLPWWREPTKDQWYAWVAAWLGWTLDAFDFTAFLLIIGPARLAQRAVKSGMTGKKRLGANR